MHSFMLFYFIGLNRHQFYKRTLFATDFVSAKQIVADISYKTISTVNLFPVNYFRSPRDYPGIFALYLIKGFYLNVFIAYLLVIIKR